MEGFGGWLTIVASLASIFTAVVALWVYLRRRRRWASKRRRLEYYLRKERETGGDKGQRTIMHLIRALGLNDAKILESAFSSKNIARRVSKDPNTGEAGTLYLVYEPNSKPD